MRSLETTFTRLSGGIRAIACQKGRRTGTLHARLRAGMLLRVLRPRAAGEGGGRASASAARERRPRARSAAAGRSVILTLHRPRGRARLHRALGVPAPLLPPPGPAGRSFSPARGGGCCSRAARLCAGPVACSGRPRSWAPGLGRVGDRRREPEPGPVNPGGKQKPGEDERARAASPPREGARGDRERLPRPPGSTPPGGSAGPAAG